MKIIDGQITPENIHLAKGFDGVSTSQNTKVPTKVYEKLNEYGIKQIAQRSAGYDYYDLDEATKNNFIISNVPVYSPESIAEFVITQALMLIRKVNEIEERTKEGDFRWQSGIRGDLLGEMTVVVIGTGHIGRVAAKLFKGFGAKVIGYDLYPNDEATKYLEYKDSVEEVVKEADVVTLHVPATADNHHQFDYEMFKQFRPTAYFINDARGAIVDTEGLLKALDESLIAGAALDTYENGSPDQIRQAIEFVKENQPKVLFVESNVDRRPMETVSSETGVAIYEQPILSDEIGKPGEAGDTYIKYLKYNLDVI